MLPYYPRDGVKLQFNESSNVGIVDRVSNDTICTYTLIYNDAFTRQFYYFPHIIKEDSYTAIQRSSLSMLMIEVIDLTSQVSRY